MHELLNKSKQSPISLRYLGSAVKIVFDVNKLLTVNHVETSSTAY